MPVNDEWLKRNLGYDPKTTPLIESAFAHPKARKTNATDEDYLRERIDFDSEAPEGLQFLAFTEATGLSRFVDPAWPKNLAPKTAKTISNDGTGPLPKADVLVVTWTVEEGHALARVLTPGKDSKADYIPYTHNYATISKKMRSMCPARNAKRLGAFWVTKIGDKKVVIFKSDSHLSQDTVKSTTLPATLPNYDVWKQIIEEVQPRLIITTGTAGGIGKSAQVGDVVVSPIVRFDGIKWLRKASFHDAIYRSLAPNEKYFSKAHALFTANADRLPKTNTRKPKIYIAKSPVNSVVTTDFFGFDISNDLYHLQGLGRVCEMGDAVLGQVAADLSFSTKWLAVRNVSDPQIEATGTLTDQRKLAAQIYKAYGRWSSVCSAIVCWALIASE